MWDVPVYAEIRNLSNPEFDYRPDRVVISDWLHAHFMNDLPDLSGKNHYFHQLTYYTGFTGLTKPEIVPTTYIFWKEGITNGQYECEIDNPEELLYFTQWFCFITGQYPEDKFSLYLSTDIGDDYRDRLYLKIYLEMLGSSITDVKITDPLIKSLSEHKITADQLSDILENRNGFYSTEEDIRFLIFKILHHDKN